MEVRDIEQLGQMFDDEEANTVKIRRKPSTALSRSAVSLDTTSGHSKTSSTGRRRLIASDFGGVDEDIKAQLRSFTNKTGADSVSLCTCQQSRNFPYCDSTHVIFNKETNSNLSPIVIKLIEQPLPQQSTSDLCCTQQCHPSTPNKTQEPEPQHCGDGAGEDVKATSPVTRKYKPSNIRDPVNKFNVITKKEVAEHRSKDSLWMIIHDNVYDITEYISFHPGGERALLKFGGVDGSENVEFHSKSMLEILNKFYFIGRLEGCPKKSFCIIS